MDALIVDELAAFKVADHTKEVSSLPELYGVDLQGTVIHVGFRGYRQPATIEASVSDGYLKEPFEAGRWMITARKRKRS